MRWAPHHTLADDFPARRGEGGNLPSKDGGNIAGAVRSGTQFGHRPEVTSLQGRHAVESHPEEALVKGSDGHFAGMFHVGQRNGTGIGQIPSVLSPFLKEVRVAPRVSDDRLDRIVVKLDAQRVGG